MPNNNVPVDPPGYSSKKVTNILVVGSLIISLMLSILLVAYDITNGLVFRERVWIALAFVTYLAITYYFAHINKIQLANGMLIGAYQAIAFLTLVTWGLNAASGIITVCFVVILSGILMGSRYILPVMAATLAMLLIVQTMHELGLTNPDLAALAKPSSYWDVAAYAVILSIFALSAWVSVRQLENSLKKVIAAESELRNQRDWLKVELEKESAKLRESQLTQVRDLHRFAILGQSAAATLHELSNLLSVLNIDIDDLEQQHANSKAISNAKESVSHINLILRKVRQQLNDYNPRQVCSIENVLLGVLKDLEPKMKRHNIHLINNFSIKRQHKTQGDPAALIQIIAILLNNAIEACYDKENPSVEISVSSNKGLAFISIVDNGLGICPDKQAELFNPNKSSKPSGMGVGLYIAKHLTKSQFKGKLNFIPGDSGAHFKITLPILGYKNINSNS